MLGFVGLVMVVVGFAYLSAETNPNPMFWWLDLSMGLAGVLLVAVQVISFFRRIGGAR